MAREYAKAGPLIVASQLGLPASTVWKVLRRYGASRLRRPLRGPVVRYERSRPGESRARRDQELGRFWTVGKRIYGDRLTRSAHTGWQYLHLAIDDHSRLAYAELLPSESPADCAAFLRLVRRARDQHRARPQRQRRRLPLSRLGGRLQRARDRPPLHPPQMTSDQSGSARQDTASRVGLSLRLSDERPPAPAPSPATCAVQPTPTTQLARRPAADQPRLTGPWVPQLAGLGRSATDRGSSFLRLPVGVEAARGRVDRPSPRGADGRFEPLER